MREYNPNLPLISVHIPKSGGTSLRSVLNFWFKLRKYSHYYNQVKGEMPRKRKLTRVFSSSFKKNVCIHGHFNHNWGFGIEDYYPEVEQFIAFIRDPVDMHISHFHYQLGRIKNGKKYIRGKLVDGILDIDEFFEKENSKLLKPFPWEINENNIPDLISKHFVHIGVMEHFQDSLDLLAEKLDKRKMTIPHKNSSPRMQKPSESVLRKFRKNSSLEYLFYEEAMKSNGFKY